MENAELQSESISELQIAEVENGFQRLDNLLNFTYEILAAVGNDIYTGIPEGIVNGIRGTWTELRDAFISLRIAYRFGDPSALYDQIFKLPALQSETLTGNIIEILISTIGIFIVKVLEINSIVVENIAIAVEKRLSS